jgi:hypothetical protein
MPFSRRTLAALARFLDCRLSHQQIGNLAFELDVEAPGGTKLERCTNLIKALESPVPPTDSNKVILELLYRYVAPLDKASLETLPEIPGLVAALRLDGYEIQNQKILPTTPQPAALAPQISALEAALQVRNLAVAARHYSQACDNLTAGNFEAANGQIRSYLENLFITLAYETLGTSFSDAGAALQHMKDREILDPPLWNTLRGIWAVCQTNGPHHGLSDAEEAIFRLHMATAVGRYILIRIP